MSNLNEMFAKLRGRPPTDAEIQRFLRIQHATGIKDNDAFWLIVFTLENYDEAYSKYPDQITEAGKGVVASIDKKIDEFAKTAIRRKVKEATDSLEVQIASTTGQIAENVSATEKYQARKDLIKWLSTGIGIATVLIGATGWAGYSKGKDAGYALGWGTAYSEAHDEKAAASWANTPEGKLGYRLAQKGMLTLLARCQGKGWKIEKGVCFPFAAQDGTYGWQLP